MITRAVQKSASEAKKKWADERGVKKRNTRRQYHEEEEEGDDDRRDG